MLILLGASVRTFELLTKMRAVDRDTGVVGSLRLLVSLDVILGLDIAKFQPRKLRKEVSISKVPIGLRIPHPYSLREDCARKHANTQNSDIQAFRDTSSSTPAQRGRISVLQLP